MWRCAKCQQQVGGTFEVCWNCGTSSDGVEDPNFRKADATAAPETAVTPDIDFPRKQGAAVWKGAAEPNRRAACPECGSWLLEHGHRGDARFLRDCK